MQSATLKPYLNCVRETLNAAMCVQNFNSQVIERHNKPEVEVRLVCIFYTSLCVCMCIYICVCSNVLMS